MNTLQAFLIAVMEGVTEYLPISSTAHMVFLSSYFGIQEDDFVKLFQVSIQFGAILAVVALYWRKFFDFSSRSVALRFYLKLVYAVIPALILGKLFDDKIEAVLGDPIPIAIVLILGGVILLFIDNHFQNPTVLKEEDITMSSYDARNKSLCRFHNWWDATRTNTSRSCRILFLSSCSNHDGSYLLFSILKNVRDYTNKRLRTHFKV
jgi:hypothetical protein